MKPAATLQGYYKGRNVYRVPVIVKLNSSLLFDLDNLGTLAEVHYSVIAFSAIDAANAIRDEWETRPETEIIAYGPKAGKTHRFIGFESAIGARICASRPAEVQTRFSF